MTTRPDTKAIRADVVGHRSNATIITLCDEIDRLNGVVAALKASLDEERAAVAEVTAKAQRAQAVLDDAAKRAVVVGGYVLGDHPDTGAEIVDVPESIESFGRSIDVLATRAEKAEAQCAALRAALGDAASQMAEIAQSYESVVCNAHFGGDDDGAEAFDRVDDTHGALARGCTTMVARFDALRADTDAVAARWFSEEEVRRAIEIDRGANCCDPIADIIDALKAKRAAR